MNTLFYPVDLVRKLPAILLFISQAIHPQSLFQINLECLPNLYSNPLLHTSTIFQVTVVSSSMVCLLKLLCNTSISHTSDILINENQNKYRPGIKGKDSEASLPNSRFNCHNIVTQSSYLTSFLLQFHPL